jgi:hypothetical protein
MLGAGMIRIGLVWKGGEGTGKWKIPHLSSPIPKHSVKKKKRDLMHKQLFRTKMDDLTSRQIER